MVKLSDSEYSHLQELRQQVADEEKRLAVKYGARVGIHFTDDFTSGVTGPLDHYEFHQQFLLIDKAKP